MCANGIKPPNHRSTYVENVNRHLYRELGVERQECSEASCKFIDIQATNFCKSVVKYWEKSGRKYPQMEQRAKQFLLDNISVEVEPISKDIPELADPPRSGGHHGPYKSFQEKSQSGQDKAIAAVKVHPPEAILRAAPAAASALGKGELATAIRMMEKQPDVLPAKAISGMKDDDSMYYLSNSYLLALFRKRRFMLDEILQI